VGKIARPEALGEGPRRRWGRGKVDTGLEGRGEEKIDADIDVGWRREKS